ncbi:hypothetical protein GALMADRAFT_355186 [Galerina marginata CBS 339.88]|uniref:LYR motif-containing protein Cup1-like N-terminal domain-containing protein n=1 Tax=Galerina marginata (strain CBS 339.88) TaxID=685588 RepID=A0A067TQ86_GALM3|nr:hypothetical protein GALMADRAFT_355186 [Galerina marginata CBS 339.88]
MSPCSLSILSIYRSYLRQVRKLPHLYLRQFFQIRARDDIQSLLSMKGQRRRELKASSIFKRVRRIEKANSGHIRAFNHVLDLAYGRVGKLKWELLEPLVCDPSTLLPEPIIPGVEKSRPPIYSPELKALLTSSLARLNRPLDRKDLLTPRSLPPRADPLSEEARLFGPFSKRREVNIRWRFFRSELKKILPPLNLLSKGSSESQTTARPLAMQGSEAFQDVERLIGDLYARPPKTRRERQELAREPSTSTNSKRHPSRWIRRRYRALLSRIPQLVFDENTKQGHFRVQAPPLAHHPHERTIKRMPKADSISMAWIEKRQ